MNRRQKRGTLSLQARGNILYSTSHFLAVGLVFFGLLSHGQAISNYEARADVYNEGCIMEHPCASQSTKRRTRREGPGFCSCPFLFFFPG